MDARQMEERNPIVGLTGNPVIGLTGGTGVGKSTVAEAFRKRGAVVLDADRIGHEVLNTDTSVQDALRRAFGDEAIGPDGLPDRRVLGSKVFGDPEALEQLNGIVHPPLLALFQSRLEAARNDPSVPLVIVDAALITEWETEGWFDRVYVVTAPAEAVHARLLAKGISEEQIRRRQESQLPEDVRVARAYGKIVNDGDVKALETAVDEIWREMVGKR